MKAINLNILLLPFLLFTFSCGKSEAEKAHQERFKIAKENDLQNEKASEDLKNKYNAITGWDSINLFTYKLQEMFNNSKLICFKGHIQDILKKDTFYILKVFDIYAENTNYYIAQISLTKRQFIQLDSIIKEYHYVLGTFIFNVSDIIPMNTILTSEIQLEGDSENSNEDSYSYLYYDMETTMTKFKGTLVDYYIYIRPNLIED